MNNQLLDNYIIMMNNLQIQIGHQSTNGQIKDFCDGQLFKSHPLFSTDPTALQLMLYNLVL